MKKLFYIFLSALTLVFAACNKQELAPAEDSSQEGQLTTVTIKASNGDADTKAAISDGLAFTWSAGDQIAVHTDNGIFYTSTPLAAGVYTDEAEFTVDLAGNRNGFAVYPASVANTWDGTDLTLTLPNTYTLAQVSGDESPLPMIAEDGGSSLSFKHVAGLLRLTISNIPTGTNKIKLDFNGKKVSGDFTISTPSAGSSSIASVAGTKGTNDIIWITGTPSSDAVTVNIPLPTGATYSDLIVSAWNGDVALRGQVVAFNTYTPVRARGKKLSAALNLGAVSIASGKYAVFAPGNLQGTYDGTSWTWDFAAHQYDYIGDGGVEKTVGNEKITSSSPWMSGSGTVDLFSWIGTSGRSDEDVTLTGVAEYGIITGLFNQHTFGNVNEPIKHDWGELSIAEYASNTWRTPVGGDSGEWAYMLSTRAGNKFAKAYLMETTHGVIVFPDNYVHPDGLAAVQGMNNTGSTSWNLNTFSAAEWTQMETAGAVFLPLAGSRTYTRQIGFDYGLYWSATGIAPVGKETLQARALMFNANYLLPNDNLTRTNGQAVRLIRDLN